jgi:hypothetical protein
MGFDPVVSRKNYTTVKDPETFKPQIEDMHATEAGGFAPDIEEEIRKMEWCDFMLWQNTGRGVRRDRREAFQSQRPPPIARQGPFPKKLLAAVSLA